jgi:hypothetical protein
MKKILFLNIVLLSLIGKAQVQPSNYPYPNAEWTYVQTWVDYFQNPPVTTYSFLTCKVYGDTIKYGKQYMKIGTVPLMGSNSYQYYRKSNDSLFTNLFSLSDSSDYLVGNYNASVGDYFNTSDTVSQLWSTQLLNAQTKRVFETINFSNSYKDTLIEDIGSNQPWFAIAYTTIVPISKLVCFKEGNLVLYYYPINFTDTNGTHINPCENAISIISGFVKPETNVIIDYGKNELKVKASNGNSWSLEIINAQGQIVERKLKMNESESIKLSKYDSGIYFYILSNKEKTERGKFLILD